MAHKDLLHCIVPFHYFDEKGKSATWGRYLPANLQAWKVVQTVDDTMVRPFILDWGNFSSLENSNSYINVSLLNDHLIIATLTQRASGYFLQFYYVFRFSDQK